jgi:hypothetical protein
VLVLAGVLGSDLFSARALAQMEQVAHTCLLRFLGFDTSETNGPRIRFFAALEEASRSEETLRAFVATP